MIIKQETYCWHHILIRSLRVFAVSMDLDVKMKAVMLGAVFLIVSSFPHL